MENNPDYKFGLLHQSFGRCACTRTRGVFRLLMHNRGVVNHTSNDNLCFFRCLSLFRGCDKRSCEQDAKQLFGAYCKHFHIDPDQFQGVFLIDFPEIEDFLKINIVVYDLQNKKKRLIQRSRELYGETMQLNVFKNHLSLIVDFEKYCDVYQCQRCDKLWYGRKKFLKHTDSCD